jgi:hypothetical protein
VAKGICNPQTALLGNTCILHGCGGAVNGREFVVYASSNGVYWDDGHMIAPVKGGCYYSNNLVLQDENGKPCLLVQYSDTYRDACVNVMHL